MELRAAASRGQRQHPLLKELGKPAGRAYGLLRRIGRLAFGLIGLRLRGRIVTYSDLISGI